MNGKNEFQKLYYLILKEKPRKAGVIVWLQGDRYDRADTVLKLYKNGWGKKIIISGNNILVGRGPRPGENNISLMQMKLWLLRKSVKEKDIVVGDGSLNTKDQAVRTVKMALAENWRSIILVGTSFYQPRAFLTFLRQAKKYQWTGKIINQPAITSGNKKPGGRDKNIRDLLEEEFNKIKKYFKQGDLVSIAEGLKYLKSEENNDH